MQLEPIFLVSESIENGLLKPVLLDYNWGEVGLYAVYPDTRFLPRRTRAFIDFLAQCFQSKPDCFNCLQQLENHPSR